MRFVSGCHNNGRALLAGGIDGSLHSSGTSFGVTTHTKIDYPGRGWVGRYTSDIRTRSPDDTVSDIRQIASTLTEYANGQHLGFVGDTDDADTVIPHRCDSAGDVSAVPGTAKAVTRVSWVVGVIITSITVVGRVGVANQVVAGEL